MDDLSEIAQLGANLLQLIAVYNHYFAMQFTYSFRPMLADYEVIFQKEIAHKMFQAYESEFWSYPDHCLLTTGDPKRTEVIVNSLSTQMLKDGDLNALNNVPGGYIEVIPYYRKDTDIVLLQVSFIEPGDLLGMSYDGFYFLDQRFVWIPKPWRLIETL